MTHDETARVLAEVLGRRNEGVVQMILTSGNVAHDLAHIEDLATISGRPLLYNVVQVYEERPYIHRSQLAWLERCRRRGIPVYGQGVTTDAGFTFTFEDWNLYDDSEAWCEATTGTFEERLANFRPGPAPALKDNLPRAASAALRTVTVLTPKSPETEPYRQMSAAQAGEAMGKHFVDALLDIAVADRLQTVFYTAPPQGDSDLLGEIVRDPYILLGVSDGGAHTKFLTAGRYPTETLAVHVREKEFLSLEDAHWRLSALPASLAGFRDRGTIKVGGPADIVVYDYEHLESLPDEVSYDLPGGEWRRIQRAHGYRWVLVNGEIIIDDDKETGAHPGQLLRHGG